MAENLKNTINIEGTEYNINAVNALYSGEADHAGLSDLATTAEKTQAALTLIRSLKASTPSDTFNGKEAKTVRYVPADGGRFTGPVYIPTVADSDLANDSIINSGQVNDRIVNLTGAPLYSWSASRASNFMEDANTVQKLSTVIGTSTDFEKFKKLLLDGSRGIRFEFRSNDTYCHVYGLDTGSSVTDWNVVIPYIATNMQNGKKVPVTGFSSSSGVLMFKGTKIASVVIPDWLVAIPNQWFMSCTSLTTVDILHGITSIGSEAFSGCTKLETITIPNTIETIGNNAFYNCSGLKTINYGGTAAEWSALISKLGTGNDKLKTITPSYYTGSAVRLGDIIKGPFMYICKDTDSTTAPVSNKILLKLPGETEVVEISKGATRLTSTTTEQNYFTFDSLTALLAQINKRLEGIGDTTLKVSHPVLESVTVTDSFNPESIPTVQQLQEEINDVSDDLEEFKELIAGENSDSAAAVALELQKVKQDITNIVNGPTIVDTATNVGTLTNNNTSSNAIIKFTIGDKTFNKTVNNVANATTASKLSNTSAIGSTTNPVYFSTDGVPVACAYSLNKTVPSSAVFTDTKVTNTLNTTAKAYITGTTTATTNTGTQVFDTGVYLSTTAGELVATTFKGALDGNAKTATSATTSSNYDTTSGTIKTKFDDLDTKAANIGKVKIDNTYYTVKTASSGTGTAGYITYIL